MQEIVPDALLAMQDSLVKIAHQDTQEKRDAHSVIQDWDISVIPINIADHALLPLILIVRPVIMELLVEYARLGTS
jgi:hypothetical protein